LQKAQIRELFLKERVLRLPLPFTGQGGFKVSENALRRLVTVMTVLFLITLAAAIASQLLESREQQMRDESAITLLHADFAAQQLSNQARDRSSVSQTARVLATDDLLKALSASAATTDRRFYLVDADGKITAAVPAYEGVVGRNAAEVLGSSYFANSDIDAQALKTVRLPDGHIAFVATRSLGLAPGNLVVLHPQDGLLNDWHSSMTKLAILFGVTLLILSLQSAAFYWQAARANEADETLGVATTRLERALDGGQCGLWDWNLAEGRIFWSASMYDILGLEPDGQRLTFGEVSSRIHQKDARLDDLAEDLLAGRVNVFDHEFRMRHENGSWVWLRARAALAPGSTPAERHLVGIVFDISRQKARDKQSAEAEVRLKDAIENISEAFVLWDTLSRGRQHIARAGGQAICAG
jgi:two-component system, cell cycle sensor histidine kinase PleC